MAIILLYCFMEQDRRHEHRVKKNLLVYSDNGSFELVGVSSNISREGLFIESPNVCGSGIEMAVVIAVNNELYRIKGEVMWSKGTLDTHPAHIPAGMGIRITEAPAEYLNYVEYLRHAEIEWVSSDLNTMH